jgi:hypothetical protein
VQLATVFTPGENLEEDEDVIVKTGVRLVRTAERAEIDEANGMK